MRISAVFIGKIRVENTFGLLKKFGEGILFKCSVCLKPCGGIGGIEGFQERSGVSKACNAFLVRMFLPQLIYSICQGSEIMDRGKRLFIRI